MKFQIIVSDPPWGFNDNLKKMKRPVKRAASAQYGVMTPAQIAAIPVADVADPMGCLLALWVPGSMLVHGLDVMRAWGFTHKQVFVWVKLKKKYHEEPDWNEATRVGMGRLFRQSHEIALIGTSGKSVYPWLDDHSQRSVAFDLNPGHSSKPPTLQQRLDIMFPDADKLEMFARRTRKGWVCAGDAIDGKDINLAIQDLAAA
jgi:N6-adenosine-specific RNA methylase IME4